MNSCYRMQWGRSQQCEGFASRPAEETVDAQLKCEKWIRDDDNKSEESKMKWRSRRGLDDGFCSLQLYPSLCMCMYKPVKKVMVIGSPSADDIINQSSFSVIDFVLF
ncbi:uncharacterized protein LOC124697107 [Lolium rigidum]|uniref:uncharacterized protein LOC124697107 n=1 Tax=Lolium rigidum TaxID=89674 RepID=UPI001F5CF78E|nr:uncharacterized protein LOC124697107 [Lolium rigidum]